MSDFTINDYDAAVAIDGSTDQFLMYQSSTTSYKKINRNTILGVTGAPADTSTAQSFSNKTLGNTNAITVLDNMLTLQDNSDNTKQVQFQLSGLTTATTRTLTIPDASTTLVGTGTTQTLTNKTLTSPVITGGSISNSAISVDSIAEYTAANGVTVDGLNIKDGKLNSNNSVVGSNLTNGIVSPEKLVSGTGSTWSWSSWVPTFTNLSGGTLTSASYIQIGKTVFYRFYYTLSGANVSGNVSFTPPVTAASYNGSNTNIVGNCQLIDTSTADYFGPVLFTSTTLFNIRVWDSSSTYLANATLNSTRPHTWANTDVISVAGTYEAA